MARPSALLDHLKRQSHDDFARVVAGIYTTITDSFREDRSRATRNEVTRRFEVCLGLLETMLMESDYSISRGLDSLGHALRCKLDGIPWEPRKSTMWLGSERVEVAGGDDEPLLWTPDRQRRGVVV